MNGPWEESGRYKGWKSFYRVEVRRISVGSGDPPQPAYQNYTPGMFEVAVIVADSHPRVTSVAVLK